MPTGDNKEVEAVKTWIVEWTSRYGQFSGDTKQEYEVFTDEKVANEFADQLRAAFKFLRHTSGTNVKVKPNQ